MSKLDAFIQKCIDKKADTLIIWRNNEYIINKNFEKVNMKSNILNPLTYKSLYPYIKNSNLHALMSITKTITGIIFGIAIERGDIKSDSICISNYFKIKNPLKRKIKIKHLLNMTSGIYWTNDATPASKHSLTKRMMMSTNWVKFVLKQKMACEPGKIWRYNNGNYVLLSYIFYKETGMDIKEYAKKYLFDPLGIPFYWRKMVPKLSDTTSGLFLDAMSLLKIGNFILNKGFIGENRVINNTFFKNSFKVVRARHKNFFGYSWWLIKSNECYLAKGYHGQYLLIFPKLNALAVLYQWRNNNKIEHVEFSTDVLNIIKEHEKV